MKGGRLHRPEPLGPHTTAAAPADDWVDGSWTVDCSCGVTFDDGEEMVSCDECNVWVHTRCARYVRGVHTSFSCHNCKSKRAPSSADEAEVAELLAELPTHRPPPLYRRWAEVPLPARVHVHGLPGGSDATLFRGAPSSPAFSAALWRCAGYVPKRFGFRYCEFPSWADDKDGADALFAFAREKRKETVEARFPLPLGAIQKNEKNYVGTLSVCGTKANVSQHVGDDGTERVPPRAEAKRASISAGEDDTWVNGCQKKGDLVVPDVMHEDQYAEMNMASSDLQAVVKAKKKMEEFLKWSGEKKSSKEIPVMLKKDEPKESMRLEISSGVRTTSAVAEQEVHSRLVKVEVSMCKQEMKRNKPASLPSGRMNSEAKMDDGNPSNGDMRIHADPEKMHEGLCLQKQSNQTSSNLQVGGGVLDLQTGQLKSQNIKSESTSQDHERTEATQFVSDEDKSVKQVLGDTAGSSIVQKNSSKLASCSGSEHPKSETQNEMHTEFEQNSVSGVAKVCTASSGSTPTHFELSHSLVSSEPSSAGKSGRLMKKEQTKLVSHADSKHDSAKYSAESSQDFSRSTDKVQPKGSLPSAPKSSQASRLYMSSAKHRLPVPKEQSQKTATIGGTPARSFHGEVTPLHSRNKAMGPSFSHKKDKTHPRFVHITQEGYNNSTPTELQASDTTASLSDEQLALLLHQQLNSSPRVPRVPRCHQAASMQMLHPTGATVFSKRSSAYGGRDQTPVLKKRNKDDALRDNDDTKRLGKVSLVERRHRDGSTERIPSVKDSCKSADNIESAEQNHGVCSNEATTGLAKDNLIDSSVSHNLPGLIDEIISNKKNITYGELCDTVREHWRDFIKPNREDFVYPSYLHAVNDCLRKRSEWAHLVDQAPKMNPNKRQKIESDSLLDDVLEEKIRNGAERDPEEGGAESQPEGLPRGRRKAQKRRRLELKGRRVKGKGKRSSSIGSSSEDAVATLSDSSSDKNDAPMDDESQEDDSISGHMEPKSADSSSSDAI